MNTCVYAADSLRTRFGVFGQFGAALPTLRYYGTEGIPNCCPQFTGGEGNVFSIGALAEIPLSNSFLFIARGGFLRTDISTSTDESTKGLVNNAEGIITFNHSFIGKFSGINVSGLFGWRITNSLTVSTGIGGTILSSPTFEQREIVKPGTRGTFLDGTRIRNSYSGHLNDAQTMVWDWNVVAGYDLPLDSERSFFITPEIIYTQGLTDMVKTTGDTYWKNSYLRGGISLKYMPKRTVIPPPAEPPPPPPPPPIVEKIPDPPTATLSLEIIEQNGTMSSDEIRIEEFVSTQMFPLLNYVFFEERSAELPKRYKVSTPTTKNDFSEKRTSQEGAISLYYSLLDIIGKRLLQFPNARITVTGSLSGGKEEYNNTTLAQQRAETIIRYLKDIWGISDDRIIIETRALPSMPANIAKPEGLAENRRVEIKSNDKRITDPIITTDTIVSGAKSLRIYPSVQTPAGLAEWTMSIKNDNNSIANYKEKQKPNSEYSIPLTQKNKSILSNKGTIVADVSVTDTKNRTATVRKSLPYSVISIQSKRTNAQSDKELDKYNLLLFGYDQANLTDDHKRIIPLIQSRIREGAKIIIKGSSDNVGDNAYNQDLSLQRAKESAKSLGIPAEVLGVGTQGAGFDNSLPEGRFYNRTVEIQVENPIK